MHCCDSVTATFILLRRFAYPCRSKDLEIVFWMHSSALSEVFYEILSLLIEKCCGLVLTFRAEFMEERAAKYAASVHERGGALCNCVGFIDGTEIEMARPIGYYRQPSVYGGHKPMLCLSQQIITTSDGLIFHLDGPVEGRQPDAFFSENHV